MAHPKRRQSSTRRDKRRTHYKAVAPQLAKDATTGEFTFITEHTGMKVNFTTEVK
jgi:ribosomal protein L32